MGLTSGNVRLVLGKLLRALHSFPEIIKTHTHTLQSTKCDRVTFIREQHMFHRAEVLHGLVHLGDPGPVQPVVARLQPLVVVVPQVVKIPGARLELRFCADCELF